MEFVVTLPPEPGPFGIRGVADPNRHVRGLDAELLGGDDGHRGAVAAADVLASAEQLDRAVAVDLDLRAHVLAGEHVPVAVRDADPALLL